MSLFQRNERNERQRRDPERPNGFCQTVGCERRVARGVTFCAACIMQRIVDYEKDERALDDWPTRPPTEFEIAAMRADVTTPLPNLYKLSAEEAQRVTQEAWTAEHELTAEQSAPLISDPQIDLRCCWCCYILAERTVTRVRPTQVGYSCAAHRLRQAAHNATRFTIARYLAAGVTSDQIADFFRNGYLGDQLHDDEPM